MGENSLSILYICSEQYAMLAGVSVTSLFSNNAELDLEVTILASKWSRTTKEKLEVIAESFSRSVNIIDAEPFDNMLQQMNLPLFGNSYTTYYRMFPSMVSKRERLLIIDADTLVLGSLRDLVHYDFQGKAFAVCCHAGADSSVTVKHKRDIGMKQNETYFQCGVILYNMQTWKERKCEERLKAHIVEVRADYPVVDQDIISIVLQEDRNQMPIKYNFFDLLNYMSNKQMEKYFFSNEVSYEELMMAAKQPVIVHYYYGFQGKPWCKNYIVKKRDFWNEYVEKTPWKDYDKWPLETPIEMKLLRLMFRIMPWSWAMDLYIFLKIR